MRPDVSLMALLSRRDLVSAISLIRVFDREAKIKPSPVSYFSSRASKALARASRIDVVSIILLMARPGPPQEARSNVMKGYYQLRLNA
jgi:hypothetical protein